MGGGLCEVFTQWELLLFFYIYIVMWGVEFIMGLMIIRRDELWG